MNAITIFALALLAVPVFARFARVTKEAMGRYHLIGLGGLFLILGEATRMTADKISPIATLLPVIDIVTVVLAYAGVLFGTLWLSVYYIKHPNEIWKFLNKSKKRAGFNPPFLWMDHIFLIQLLRRQILRCFKNWNIEFFLKTINFEIIELSKPFWSNKIKYNA